VLILSVVVLSRNSATIVFPSKHTYIFMCKLDDNHSHIRDEQRIVGKDNSNDMLLLVSSREQIVFKLVRYVTATHKLLIFT